MEILNISKFSWLVLFFLSSCSITTKNHSKRLYVTEFPLSVLNDKSLRSLTIVGLDCDYIVKGEESTCKHLDSIPKAIVKLHRLRELSFILCNIKYVPLFLLELKGLKSLNLSHNFDINICNIIFFKHLESLDLSECGLSELPEKIDNLKNLKHLYLGSNKFSGRERERIVKLLPNCEVVW